MGWAHCGTDSKGREIGYSIRATCDHPGCKKKIDRGLDYACGGMHGPTETCEGYFCHDHLTHVFVPSEEGDKQVCHACAAMLTEAKAEDHSRALIAIVDECDGLDRDDPVAVLAALDAVLKTTYAALIQWDEGDELPIDARYMEPYEVTKYEKVAEHRKWYRDQSPAAEAEA